MDDAISGLNLDLLSVIVFPASEKTRSDGADVTGIQNRAFTTSNRIS
jgi:hypothetical protein